MITPISLLYKYPQQIQKKKESSLEKKIIKNHANYTFKFISISKEASNLRKKEFNNPYKIAFGPQTDVIDNKSILDYITSLDIDKIKEIYGFIKKELGGEINMVKLDSNLATVINILSKEDLTTSDQMNVNVFEIERKVEYNQLSIAKHIIDDYAKYHPRLDKKYTEFDIQGSNKSLSILQSISKNYIATCVKYKDQNADTIFLQVIEDIMEKINQSANYNTIPIDELELCVNILVVDAFIRCKIFKNPKNYNYAIT